MKKIITILFLLAVIAGNSQTVNSSISTGVGTKALRYNPTTRLITYADTTTGGSTSPAGNFGNLQIGRNGAFATPGSDSLDWESSTGLTSKGNINVTGTNNQLSMFDGTAFNTSVNTITWGTNYNEPALYLYDGGSAGVRYGWGLRAGNMQFFIPDDANFSVNSGGDFQAAGTNVKFVVDRQNNRIRLNMATGIGTAGVTPDASAILEVASTTQGVLMPRMTATQGSAIGSPADGLLIYVTDTNGTFTSVGFWGRESGAWVKL